MKHCRSLVIASAVLLGATGVQADEHAERDSGQTQSYRAGLSAVNPLYAGGGRVELKREGDQLLVRMLVESLSPNMMHLQHLHGSRDGMEAFCPPTNREAMTNGELVDLMDTRLYSGITLIPLHDDPVSLEIKAHTYPKSDDTGGYVYEQRIDWSDLQQAVNEKYGIKDLDLSRMVIYVHGVPEKTDLPESTRSLPGVPAHVTLPVACGEIKKWDPQEGAGLIE